MKVQLFIGCLLTSVLQQAQAQEAPGVSRIRLLNYDNCIQLENGTTRVVLGHHRGGRILAYTYKGKDSLYLDPEEANWNREPRNRVPVSAGRFDIGPEKIIPRREALWSGPWTPEVIGPRKARLVSAPHDETGVQLIREFSLAETGSHLRCTQIIRNISQRTTRWAHWSRTFAQGDGICVIPLSEWSRMPKHYVMYEPGNRINIAPDDPNIRTREGYLEILAAPKYPKLGMDAMVGWFAYQMRNNLLFVKKYRTHPSRVYNELAGLTISIWYPDGPMCELEPIGPEEVLEPGEAAAFTEDWWLFPNQFPSDGELLDLENVRDLAESAK